MLLAFGLICFVLGFAAAADVAARPGKRWRDAIKILNQIPVTIQNACFQVHSSSKHTPFPGDVTLVDNLVTKDQIENQYDMSTWQRLAYEDFKTTILAKETELKTFPCIYATMGYRSNEHRYLFLESDNPAEPQNIRLIGPALQSYLSISPQLGSNTSLVIIAAPSESNKSVTEYNNSFWEMLRGLRIWDQQPWPEMIPLKTEDEKWMFCFDGQPVFPVMLTPAHTRRWSRHMSVPVIALQPKWVLDQLLSTPERREAATSKVRKLLKEYDQIDISPDLTSFGAPGTSESRQLCLLDENKTATCPYNNIDR